MGRLLIHAGFHKTGTTSVQQILAQNATLLAGSTRIVLRDDLAVACKTARAFSARRTPENQAAFANAITGFFTDLDRDDPRDILISAEDLSGLMPGRRSLTTYDAAPILMQMLHQIIQSAGPTFDEVIYYFSLRAPAPWLLSCHNQHVRAVRMLLDAETYAKTFADSADLDQIVEDIRRAVAPCRVESAPLEACKSTPLAPLTPIADILGWPEETRAAITLRPPANSRMPDGLRDILLELNRSPLEDDALREAKKKARRKWDRANRAKARKT